jgi:predicted LPLAT superfamily acyltransferase
VTTGPAPEPAGGADGTAWTARRERSNAFALTAMRRIALFFGRRLARLLLVPITAWFVLGDADLRRHSRRYLARALGRPATLGDVWRHVHAFASTVLDRVYLLSGRFDAFRVDATGREHILDPFARGEGVLAVGAHLGSFEALRMVGHGKGLRVAMIMYEDNARLINASLAAIAPDLPPEQRLVTIPLGRPESMLALRRWLDAGGVAGMLADRTLPGGDAARSKTVRVPFLGTPAPFPDGPFRLAAMLRRRLVFMAGLYRGGDRYDMRFEELADFSALPPGPAAREAAIREAIERYVATLENLCREAPSNWFNFYDFWGEDARRAPAAAAPSDHAPV